MGTFLSLDSNYSLLRVEVEEFSINTCIINIDFFVKKFFLGVIALSSF